MHALKTPSFLKPASRTSSPAFPPPPLTYSPDLSVPLEPLPPMSRSSSKGPLNRLSLASKRRPSASPTPPPTPTLVQDGSYLEALSLKLSNAVSKALAQPTGPPAPGEVMWNGKRVLPKSRGSALGVLIGSELEASASNPYLHRAILRSLHRPLSVMLSNLSAQLLPVTSSPEFAAHPTPAAPSPAQLYAAAFATFAAELLVTLDSRGLSLPDNHGVVGIADNLRGICESLESLIGRVIIPLVSQIRKELVPLIDALEFNVPVLGSPSILPKQSTAHNKGVLGVHPLIGSLQCLIHSHARNLTCYTTPPSMTSQATLATLLISLIWHGLVALSRRAPIPRSSSITTVPNQPTALPTTLRWKKAGNTTPPTTSPPPARFSLKLPPSRPPSPPSTMPPCPAMDARLLFNLFNVLPRPSEDSRYVLAREAVDEAFRGLASLCALLDYEAAGNLENLDGVTTDLPTVIALPVLLRIFGRAEDEKGSGEAWDVPSLLGVTDQEYRNGYLGGFGMAEEGGPRVAKCVLDSLVERHDAKCERLIQWLEGRANLGD